MNKKDILFIKNIFGGKYVNFYKNFRNFSSFGVFYIFYLETLATSSDATSRVFNMSREELKRPSVDTLFKNQGVYNALIGILILISIYILTSQIWLGIFLSYIIIVALFGAITSDKMIILKQGGIAILALISLLF